MYCQKTFVFKICSLTTLVHITSCIYKSFKSCALVSAKHLFNCLFSVSLRVYASKRSPSRMSKGILPPNWKAMGHSTSAQCVLLNSTPLSPNFIIYSWFALFQRSREQYNTMNELRTPEINSFEFNCLPWT